MSDSIHDKLNRVRKPRVHITYDVETNGAARETELPFVVGVMGDYSGDNPDKKSLKDRKFIQIDRDNFDDIMGKVEPKVNLKVENTIEGGDSEMGVELNFNSMADFEPQNIVQQVEPLKQLMEARNKLRDLMTKVDRSEELESILEEVLQNTAKIQGLSEELGVPSEES
ncbi:MAG: type VI secretion system contractile sheath small subunit [Pseudomonadales bacterium]|nr:type VI secretion system contractile sheath small subunit [Pseudomonadales bacterium]